MFLATTALKEFWNASDEIALLGPWCVRFDDPGWLAGLATRRLPNVWDDRAELARAADRCRRAHDGLLTVLAERLNALHGVAFGERYWRIVIGPWLFYHVQQLFDRRRSLDAAYEAHPNLRTIALAEEDYRTPRDTPDFLALFHSDHYNLQLYSHILKFTGRNAPVRRLEAPSGERAPKDANPVRAAARAIVRRSRTAQARLTLRFASVDLLTDGLDPLGALHRRLVRKLGGRVVAVRQGPSEEPRPVGARDGGKRATLADLPVRGELERLVASTLPVFLPALFLEGYAAERRASAEAGARMPKAVFGSNGLYYNEAFKFRAAEFAERGARLWGFQHGGQYGFARFSQPEAHERAVGDAYFTWGWSSQEPDDRLEDLPVPPLSEEIARVRGAAGGGGEILLVSTSGLKNPHELFPNPLGWQWEEFIAWRERFIAALGPALPASLRVRLFHKDYGWNHRGRLEARFPGLRFDDRSTPLLGRLRRTRLAVVDHPGTAFLEVLALGVPSVHFWDERLWELRPAAEPLFDGLRKAGVVHRDPESAARQVLKVRDDPRAWWDSEETRSARRRITERYARTSADWIGDWARVLKGELNRPAAAPRTAPTRA